MTEDVDDLIQTLEDIRKDDYPDLPEGLVSDIVEIESTSIEDRSEAPIRIDDVVESHLDEED